VLNREIPFLRIVVPLCLGIVTGLGITPGDIFFMVSGASVVILFCISLLFNRQPVNHFHGFSLTVFLFLCGLFLYTKEKSRLSLLDHRETIFVGHLSDYPEEKEKSRRLTFRAEARITDSGEERINGSIVLYCSKSNDFPALIPGDRLIISCTPEEIRSRGNPNEFNYRFYMQNNGIKYYAFIDHSDILIHSIPQKRKLTHRALIIREKIIGMFRERGIEGDRLAVVAALTLGQKDLLDPGQKQHFIRAGVMHIMAVSGLHAMILSMFIFRMLFFLRGRLNIIRVILTIIALWAFAFITGLTSSVTRAALMYSFLQTGHIIKRPVNGINSVLASAFLLILARPSVIFDAGFQLSYAAVIYIILFYREFYLKIHFKHRIPDLIWQSAAVSIIAQAGTLPFTVMLFNRFPVWFVISNIVIVPLASLVIILGVMFPMTYPVVFFSKSLAGMIDILADLTEHLTGIASSLPFSTIENIGITVPECLLLTVAVFLLTRFLLNRKSTRVIFPLISLLLFVASNTAKEILVRRSSELIVYNSAGASAIGVRTGNALHLFSDSLPAGQEVKRHSAVNNLRVHENELKEGALYLETSGKKILITNSLSTNLFETTMPDFIVLTGEKPVIDRNIEYKGSPEAVIVCHGGSSNRRISEAAGRINAGEVHHVQKQGAFCRRL